MADIARRLDVSRATVSRALRRDPQISAAVTARVQAAARELGYQRDPAFDILDQHRKGVAGHRQRLNLAMLTANDLHTRDYAEAARRQAGLFGYALDLIALQDYLSEGSLDRILRARGVRGIVLPMFDRKHPLPRLDWNAFSVVCCGVDFYHPPFHAVRSNVTAKVEMAWRACVERGYRRVGIALLHNGPNELDVLRAGNALYRLHAAGASAPPLFFEPFSRRDTFGPWLEKHRPDAVVVSNAALLPAVDACAERAGAALPHCCLLPHPGRCATGSRPGSIASAAVMLLHQQIIQNLRGAPEEPHTILIEPEWIEGTTLPLRSRRA